MLNEPFCCVLMSGSFVVGSVRPPMSCLLEKINKQLGGLNGKNDEVLSIMI